MSRDVVDCKSNNSPRCMKRFYNWGEDGRVCPPCQEAARVAAIEARVASDMSIAGLSGATVRCHHEATDPWADYSGFLVTGERAPEVAQWLLAHENARDIRERDTGLFVVTSRVSLGD